MIFLSTIPVISFASKRIKINNFSKIKFLSLDACTMASPKGCSLFCSRLAVDIRVYHQ
ncbi:MAG: hypothetical protein AB8U25_05580 [Rickettsiales endosymbiont of Dermacentor nuttalli]